MERLHSALWRILADLVPDAPAIAPLELRLRSSLSLPVSLALQVRERVAIHRRLPRFSHTLYIILMSTLQGTEEAAGYHKNVRFGPSIPTGVILSGSYGEWLRLFPPLTCPIDPPEGI